MVERVAAVEARVDTLEERFDKHEERQNGHMQRLEAKADKILYWLIGTMGGVVASLILLIINLASKRG